MAVITAPWGNGRKARIGEWADDVTLAKRQAATGNRQPGASIDVGGDDDEELGNRFLQVDDRRSVSPLIALDGLSGKRALAW
jgi:hypothetical protein